MATSTNYGWSEPDNTSLVKDGALAIRTLGNAIDTSLWNSGYGQAGKNKLINADCLIAQRGTASVTLSSSFQYPVDRFWVTGGTGQTAIQTSTGLTGTPNAIRMQRTAAQTGVTSMTVGQTMETKASIPLQGSIVTLSFYARAGATWSGGAITARVYTGTGTDQSGWGFNYTGTANPLNENKTLTTSWQRFSVSGTIASSATQVQVYIFGTPSGTAGATDYFDITNVQLEYGSTATPFQTASGGSIQGELAMCQRYYVRYANEAANNILVASANYNTTQAYSVLPFITQMRIAPTLAVSAAGNFNVYVNNTSIIASGFSSGEITTKAARLLWTCSGLTTGHAGFIQNNTASAYLEASAEL